MKRIITLFFALATISFSFAQSNEILKAKRSVKEASIKLGQTDLNRKLFIAFTVRDKKIRVISGRDMTKKEKRIYDEKI